VIPSLDAGDASLFDYVNRPHEDITFERMAEGLVEFAHHYSGRLWLEVLLVSGVTGLPSEAKNIAVWAQKINAQKIQLGTVNRPAYEDFACAVDPKQMKKLVGLFSGSIDLLESPLPEAAFGAAASDTTDADILNLLARRPCTLEGISLGLNLHPHDAAKRIEKLMSVKRVATQRNARTLFYKLADKAT
jgi:wyosine [tRNA(Phe)-imidazoG37] synthetase (radical SAM superfamily)